MQLSWFGDTLYLLNEVNIKIKFSLFSAWLNMGVSPRCLQMDSALQVKIKNLFVFLSQTAHKLYLLDIAGQ